nr:hypothetical protein [uncultured Pseudomonas sp.]
MQAFTLRMCADCGQPFMQVRLNHKFCHVNCRNRSHRRYKNQPEEAAQAQIGIIEYYKQVIGKLSDQQMMQAVFTILNQTPEQNKQRKESILHSLKE